jgi:hypothetical protein
MSKGPGSLREETPAADNLDMAERKDGIPDPVNGPVQHDPDGQEPDILPVRFLRVVDARRRLAQGWLIPQPELIARALILRAALD